MALPKKKIIITQTKVGKERIDELLDLTNEKSTFLPKSILLKDLERGMMDFTKDTHLKVNSKDKIIPVIFLTKERWAEFATNWKYSNDDGNVNMPFITLRRSEAPKQGSNENIKYRIAQNKKFTYLKVPTFDNGVNGIDIYKIPQPVPIDLTFEIRIFTHYMRDLNTFNELIQKVFANGQAYTFIKGHYIPLKLSSVSDESTMNEVDGQRFYSQTFTILMMGYLQDINDSEVVKGVRRMLLNVKEKNNED